MSLSKRPKPLKKFVQLTELDKSQGWLENGVVIPFERLTDKKLQEALIEMEVKELGAFNRSAFFGTIADKLMQEADRRGLQVEHYNTEFTEHNKTRHLPTQNEQEKGS